MSRDEEMTNKEALNVIADMCNALQLHPNSRQGKAMMKAINSLKNGTPPAKNKGEWIPQPSNKEQGERDFVWWKCSKCGQVIYSETEKDREEFHAFCGRCGADMRGEEK